MPRTGKIWCHESPHISVRHDVGNSKVRTVDIVDDGAAAQLSCNGKVTDHKITCNTVYLIFHRRITLHIYIESIDLGVHMNIGGVGRYKLIESIMCFPKQIVLRSTRNCHRATAQLNSVLREKRKRKTHLLARHWRKYPAAANRQYIINHLDQGRVEVCIRHGPYRVHCVSRGCVI